MSDDKKADERDEEALQKALDQLGEMFDTVQIFVTRNVGETDGNTVFRARCVGNHFARLGQVRDWLIRRDEETRVEVRKQLKEEEGDEDGD
jgi:hypothetical protein